MQQLRITSSFVPEEHAMLARLILGSSARPTGQGKTEVRNLTINATTPTALDNTSAKNPTPASKREKIKAGMWLTLSYTTVIQWRDCGDPGRI